MTKAKSEGRGTSGSEATVRFAVPEMDCPSCAKKVERSLESVGGVKRTELEPTSGTATVGYDPKETDEGGVAAAIEAAGYGVEESGGDDPAVAPPTAVWWSGRAKRTWIGALFLAAALAVEFLPVVSNTVVGTLPAVGASVTVADALFLTAAVTSGTEIVRNGLYSARNRSLDIDLLMGTAIVAATAIGYVLEAATLAVLFSVAELLEEYAMDKARNSLRELMELSPDSATVRRDGEEQEVPAEEVVVGETVLVRPGEKIPLDGVVEAGESAVDESPITGESVPVDKSPGADVYAGSINAEGYLEIEVTSTAGDSTLSRIIESVRGAQAEKTETERFVDRFAGYYTPIIVAAAIATALLPPLLIADPVTVTLAGYPIVFDGAWGTWFVRGLTLLVIACPCAFVISTPVSVVSGITSAAKNGVLIRGGSHLEAMGEVDVIALDKTGTLTEGELAVTDVLTVSGSEMEVLSAAAAVERRSEHPIAAAIRSRADEAGADGSMSVSDFEGLPGRGVRAELDGKTHYAGKPGLFAELDLDPERIEAPSGEGTLADVLESLESEGKTVILVGTDGEVLGAVAVADRVRPESKRAVARLKELGVGRVVMLTGDNEGTARAVAESVGVDDYRAGLLPDEKVEAIEELSADGAVAMVGDGINDAPALAAADVGIAMGAAGTDTAIETADIALMGDDIGSLPYLYALSRRAGNVIRQNIWASLGVKLILAVGVPLGFVSVALAVVVGDMGMSLGVTGNAMRLSRVTPDRLFE